MIEQARLRKASWMSSPDFPADAQAAEPVQQGQGLLDDPAVHAQSRAVVDAAAAMSGRQQVMPDPYPISCGKNSH
ncbi:hypothetical protein C8D88_108228 [Lentzea atacamensis]|uniref:Uncharacterized protein n=1 Tax=Lentzea atacamensis TaxID=531938 RepID=A0A316HWW5_9PSEU|nr:hypothetical protein C8D88_108228 [Lentzea atacamensis]